MEEIKKSLYRRDEKISLPERDAFNVREDRARQAGKPVPESPLWINRTREPEGSLNLEVKKNSSKIMRKIFWTVILFVAAAVLTAAYFVFFGNAKAVSARNIDIEAQYSPFTDGGAINDVNLAITNRNTVALELADLIVNFPESTFSPDGKKLGRERYTLGVIKSGETVNKKLSVVFYGNENDEKETKATLEYRLADSNAIFAKESSFSVKISRSPVSVSVAVPKEINSGEVVAVAVDVVSNSESDIDKLLVRMEYPPGFQFISALPAPSQDKNEWSVGYLKAGEKRTINIKGTVQGQDLEEKGFRAEVGVLGEDKNLKPYGIAAESLQIKRPFLGLDILVNGEKSDKAFVSTGSSVNVGLRYINNLAVPVRNAIITAKISGAGFDEKTIEVRNGDFRPGDQAAVWNASSLTALTEISPGAGGEANFVFRVPQMVSNAGSGGAGVHISASITGQSISPDQQTADVSGASQQDIQLASRLQFASRATFFTGPFENAGPIPPKVKNETTYTVTWSLGNNSNDFANVNVISSLPVYIRWIGNVSPNSENISFDEVTGRIVWNVGSLRAGTGVNSPARMVSFQIGLTPSASQIGSSPILVSQMSLSGHDLLIDRDIQDSRPALTTELDQDPQFRRGQGAVSE